MKFIPGLVKKLLKMVLAGAFTFVVAACYGIVIDYRFLFHVQDPGEQPIQGLKLELIQSGETLDISQTDVDGNAELFATEYDTDSNEYNVTITDIDGTENGEFQRKEMIITSGDDYEEEYTVTMDPVLE
ncbi:MAG: hypothetical protein JXB88_08030 [Spirochaetales bacterium]|nr:hypothetical protein [Spirochaetales bacterium]